MYLDELYNNYKKYCHHQHFQPASKQFVTKVTETVFLAMGKKRKKKKGPRITRLLFCDLSMLQDQDLENECENIIFPDFCEIHSRSMSSVSFSVPTVYILNGRTVNLDVSLGNSALTIRVSGVKIDLEEISFSGHVSYTQRHVDSVLKLATVLRLCRGVVCEAGDASKLVEGWGRVGSPVTETRSRSNACNIVLGFESKTEVCAACQGDWRYYQKRVGSRTTGLYFPGQDNQQLQNAVKLEGQLASDLPDNDQLTCNGDRAAEAQETFPKLDRVKVKVEVDEENAGILTCVVCGRHCKNAGGLRTHEKSHYNKIRHVCQFCGRVCPNSASLHRHERTHTGERPALCSQCGKRFRRMSSLRTHERTHSKEKPYKCSQCPRRFSYSGSLSYHILLHEGGKRSSKESLRRFQCEVCGKKFAKKNGLSRHTLIHTGIKPHQCKFCGKGFSQSNTLDDHVKIHTGVRPHRCSVCSKTFIQKSNLRGHMRCHKECLPGDLVQQAKEPGDLEKQTRGPDDLEKQARGPDDIEKQARAPGDLEKQARAPGDLEKQARAPGDLEKQARAPGDLEKQATAPDNLEKQARAPGDLEKQARAPGDLEKQARAPGNLEKEARAGIAATKRALECGGLQTSHQAVEGVRSSKQKKNQ